MKPFPQDIYARLKALEAHAKREGQQMCDGAEAERSDQTKGNDMKTDSLTDAINGYKAGLAGEPMGIVSADFDFGWTIGHFERATQGAATPPAPVAWMSPGYPQIVTDEWKRENIDEYAFAKDFTVPLFATPPAIREPEPTDARWHEANVRQLEAALATPAPAPSIPTEQVLALLEAGGFIKAGKLELARAIIASVHPAGLAPGAVEQGMPPRSGA